MNLRVVQTSQNATEIRGEGGQHFGTLAAHAHQTNSRLGVCAHLDAVDDADGINLSLPPG